MTELAGTIIEGAEPADRGLVGIADPAIDENRTEIINGALRDRGEYGAILGLLFAFVSIEILKSPLVRGKLSLSSLRRIFSAFDKNSDKAILDLWSSLEKNVRRALEKTLLAQNEAMRNQLLGEMSPERRKQLVEKALQRWRNTAFPKKTGVKPSTRLDAYERMLRKKLARETTVDATRKGVEGINKSVKQAFIGKMPGRTPVIGGSTYKQMYRLGFSEQARMSQQIAADYARDVGFKFLRWTLHPMHPWYGGKEICEVLASQVHGDTVAMLNRMGVDPARFNLEGVYPIGQYPDYPHPFCMCSPQPVFIQGHTKLKFR